MTPKISLDLSESGCRKPGCKRRFSRPNRHHVRHEKHWINYFQIPGRPPPSFKGDTSRGQRLLRKLTERYHQFRKEDTEIICEWHHAEIHIIYTEIKMDYCARRNLHPDALRLDDAFRIMRLCKKRFYQWLKYPSPGIRPSRAGWREKRP